MAKISSYPARSNSRQRIYGLCGCIEPFRTNAVQSIVRILGQQNQVGSCAIALFDSHLLYGQRYLFVVGNVSGCNGEILDVMVAFFGGRWIGLVYSGINLQNTYSLFWFNSEYYTVPIVLVRFDTAKRANRRCVHGVIGSSLGFYHWASIAGNCHTAGRQRIPIGSRIYYVKHVHRSWLDKCFYGNRQFLSLFAGILSGNPFSTAIVHSCCITTATARIVF